MSTINFSVLGSGSWGTAIAVHLSQLGHNVTLWGRDAGHVMSMQKTRQNSRYLPDIDLPDALILTHQLEDALNKTDIIILAVPSHAFAGLLAKIKPYISSFKGLIWLTKGLDPETGDFLSQTLMRVLGNKLPKALLTGPSFAREVALKKPTAVVIASEDEPFALRMKEAFHDPFFRTYYCSDLQGAELGGVIKNVLTIAVGMADGLQCGANARAALITRGLFEMRRLGKALQVDDETLSGLSGMGDLILSATDDQSRNRRFGLLIGQGESIASATNSINQSIEGKLSAKILYEKAQVLRVSLPISEQVYRILYENMKPNEALQHLLSRDVGKEVYTHRD